MRKSQDIKVGGVPDRLRTGRSAWGLYRETRRPGAPGLLRRLLAAPRLVGSVLRRDYPGLSRGKLLGFAALALIYLVSPVDAIPDFIPVLGWTDDGAVALWFVSGVVRESGRYVEWESGLRR
ncbi:YkvA family protein [Actinacidiphila sp. ITFR-21]|uniref:YkvA family protein n=1 Tax=Actinacidiphila sp. ITFR-21 TaxID=3075199 RepID=UPI00288C16A6|nr:YkvA family protein [Streptomyces sp. ITFR-21]WNI14467.1 YkvA family protein [Streptomyces sp. ITFR-21]